MRRARWGGPIDRWMDRSSGGDDDDDEEEEEEEGSKPNPGDLSTATARDAEGEGGDAIDFLSSRLHR